MSSGILHWTEFYRDVVLPEDGELLKPIYEKMGIDLSLLDDLVAVGKVDFMSLVDCMSQMHSLEREPGGTREGEQPPIAEQIFQYTNRYLVHRFARPNESRFARETDSSVSETLSRACRNVCATNPDLELRLVGYLHFETADPVVRMQTAGLMSKDGRLMLEIIFEGDESRKRVTYGCLSYAEEGVIITEAEDEGTGDNSSDMLRWLRSRFPLSARFDFPPDKTAKSHLEHHRARIQDEAVLPMNWDEAPIRWLDWYTQLFDFRIGQGSYLRLTFEELSYLRDAIERDRRKDEFRAN